MVASAAGTEEATPLELDLARSGRPLARAPLSVATAVFLFWWPAPRHSGPAPRLLALKTSQRATARPVPSGDWTPRLLVVPPAFEGRPSVGRAGCRLHPDPGC